MKYSYRLRIQLLHRREDGSPCGKILLVSNSHARDGAVILIFPPTYVRDEHHGCRVVHRVEAALLTSHPRLVLMQTHS